MTLPRNFCEHLEWRLSGALSYARDKSLRRYWCDGILDPELDADNWPVLVRQSRQLKAQAWIDEGRTKGQNATQRIYQLTINLGPAAFAAYVLGNSLDKFVPDSGYDDWVFISPDKRIVEVWLL
ncbi:hypothetical protein J0X19_19580 [Hymenobacter sp. BT186]|uniref:Uncharacterized protein n=1 Tax=Hymenobacter telluris TaxID=2816474 RepID=A0A939F0Q1_9BACT|nr:hypothetical protein [Hymenobacter telluris]MBO0360172.1 hypothetical protein [Hymenobacter telluris]MBW3376199.1 hypothetical protein [Hymenobacter norwichensis]